MNDRIKQAEDKRETRAAHAIWLDAMVRDHPSLNQLEYEGRVMTIDECERNTGEKHCSVQDVLTAQISGEIIRPDGCWANHHQCYAVGISAMEHAGIIDIQPDPCNYDSTRLCRDWIFEAKAFLIEVIVRNGWYWCIYCVDMRHEPERIGGDEPDEDVFVMGGAG